MIKEIGEDFSDGISLITLLEVLSQKKVGKYNKRPRVHAQKMENLEKALDFITKTEGIYLVNIGKTDKRSFSQDGEYAQLTNIH